MSGDLRSRRVGLRLFVALLAIVSTTLIGVPAASAAPTSVGGRLSSIKLLGDNVWEVVVHSSAMNADIPLQVLRPTGLPSGAPTLYLLNGAGGGEDGANWLAQTDAAKFFVGKNVNVVIPSKGIGSYYTDWIRNDPKVGKPMWQTFLTKELPGVIDKALNTNGRKAIAGLSMAGTSVFNLAIAAPGLFRAVASYSGCAQTSMPIGQAAVRGIVYTASGANADNMWGPAGSPIWERNDPYIHADKLRGTKLYISSGSGLAGKYDNKEHQAPGAPPIEDQIIVGGALEAATRLCTETMVTRLRDLNIPATFHLPATGTHSWGYWQDELHRSWPTIAAGLRS